MHTAGPNHGTVSLFPKYITSGLTMFVDTLAGRLAFGESPLFLGQAWSSTTPLKSHHYALGILRIQSTSSLKFTMNLFLTSFLISQISHDAILVLVTLEECGA